MFQARKSSFVSAQVIEYLESGVKAGDLLTPAAPPRQPPGLLLAPGLAIVFTAIAVNLIADALRDGDSS